MDRIGISFKGAMTSDEVRERYIEPLRGAFETSRAGIYSNYLRQTDEGEEPEHLLVFQVREFENGLRLLRVELQRIGVPGVAMFHNLNSSTPLY